MIKKKVVIIGALGMDFHVFNTVFRDNEEYDVVAFTIAGEQNVGTTEETERRFPAELAGELYPNGIPMVSEDRYRFHVGFSRESLQAINVSHYHVNELRPPSDPGMFVMIG